MPVTILPPEYYGLYGLGKSLQGIQDTRERKGDRKTAEEERQFTRKMQELSLIHKLGGTEAATQYLKSDPDFASKLPEGFEALIPRDEQIAQATQRGAGLDPKWGQSALDLPTMTGEQIGRMDEANVTQAEQGVQLGAEQIATQEWENFRRLRENVGPEQAQAMVMRRLTAIGERFPELNLQATPDEIRNALLADSPEDFQRLLTLGSSSPEVALTREAASTEAALLEPANIRSQINLRGAQAASLMADAEYRRLSAQFIGSEGSNELLTKMREAEGQQLIKHGISANLYYQFTTDPGSLTDEQLSAVNTARRKHLASLVEDGDPNQLLASLKLMGDVGVAFEDEASAAIRAQAVNRAVGREVVTPHKPTRRFWPDGDWTLKIIDPEISPDITTAGAVDADVAKGELIAELTRQLPVEEHGLIPALAEQMGTELGYDVALRRLRELGGTEQPEPSRDVTATKPPVAEEGDKQQVVTLLQQAFKKTGRDDEWVRALAERLIDSRGLEEALEWARERSEALGGSQTDPRVVGGMLEGGPPVSQFGAEAVERIRNRPQSTTGASFEPPGLTGVQKVKTQMEKINDEIKELRPLLVSGKATDEQRERYGELLRLKKAAVGGS